MAQHILNESLGQSRSHLQHLPFSPHWGRHKAITSKQTNVYPCQKKLVHFRSVQQCCCQVSLSRTEASTPMNSCQLMRSNAVHNNPLNGLSARMKSRPASKIQQEIFFFFLLLRRISHLVPWLFVKHCIILCPGVVCLWSNQRKILHAKYMLEFVN